MSYYIGAILDCDFDTAVRRTTEELAKEGFGILTEIDVQAKLAEKLGVERLPYRILGACNPAMASQAIELEPCIGALMPCSVAVHQRQDGRIEVAAMDPAVALATTGNVAITPLAEEARQRLTRAIAALKG